MTLKKMYPHTHPEVISKWMAKDQISTETSGYRHVFDRKPMVFPQCHPVQIKILNY